MFVTVARRSTHPPLSPLSLDGQPLPQILSAYLFIFYSVYLHSRAFGPTQQTCIYAPCCSKRCRRIITHTVLVPNKPLVFICPPPHQPISPHVLVYMCILSIYSYIYITKIFIPLKNTATYSLALRARTGNRNQSTLLFLSCKPLLFISHLTHSYNGPGIGKKFSPGPS
jgi:hypothetical protein